MAGIGCRDLKGRHLLGQWGEVVVHWRQTGWRGEGWHIPEQERREEEKQGEVKGSKQKSRQSNEKKGGKRKEREREMWKEGNQAKREEKERANFFIDGQISLKMYRSHLRLTCVLGDYVTNAKLQVQMWTGSNAPRRHIEISSLRPHWVETTRRWFAPHINMFF